MFMQLRNEFTKNTGLHESLWVLKL